MDKRESCMSGTNTPAGLLLCTLAVFGFLVGACGSDGTATDADRPDRVAPTGPDSDSAGSDSDSADSSGASGDPAGKITDGGWIGGEPDWSLYGDETAEAVGDRLESYEGDRLESYELEETADVSYSEATSGMAAGDDDHPSTTTLPPRRKDAAFDMAADDYVIAEEAFDGTAPPGDTSPPGGELKPGANSTWIARS